MMILLYFIVFLAALLVDIVPLIGPPAWTVMAFLQLQFDLNIWLVLVVGVFGSALGRYIYSSYVPFFSARFITARKNDDLQFMGSRLSHATWKVQLFVLLYTLLPFPSTPLFTAAGVAKIRTVTIIPSFFIGKFLSDAAMVLTSNYVVHNADNIMKGFFSFKTLAGTVIGIILICLFLFINWKKLLLEKKFRISFNIWK